MAEACLNEVILRRADSAMSDWRRLAELMRITSPWVTVVAERWKSGQPPCLDYWRVEALGFSDCAVGMRRSVVDGSADVPARYRRANRRLSGWSRSIWRAATRAGRRLAEAGIGSGSSLRARGHAVEHQRLGGGQFLFESKDLGFYCPIDAAASAVGRKAAYTSAAHWTAHSGLAGNATLFAVPSTTARTATYI